jgi:hypothetical protein
MALSANYVQGRYLLAIDGHAAGYLNAYTPPNLKVENIKNAAGPDGIIFQAMGNMSYTDWKCTYAFSHSGPLYDVVAALINKSAVEFQARVDILDQNYKSKRAVDKADNLIKEIAWSKLDVKDGKALFDVTMTAACTSAKYLPGDDKAAQAVAEGKAKRLLKSNFRIAPPHGLNAKAIVSMDLPKLTVKHAKEGRGDEREELLHYASYEISNPKSVHSSIDYKAITDLVKKVMQDGVHDEKSFMPMAATLLSHDMKTEQATWEMEGCVPYEFTFLEGEAKANSDTMAQCSLTWTVEGLKLKQMVTD